MATEAPSAAENAEPLSIAKQAKKIEADCERAAIRDALVSSRWSRRNLRLGLASAIAAAVAAFVAGNGSESLNFLKVLHIVGADFNSEKSVIALFAMISAVLTSVLTFLRPSQFAESFQESSNKYHAMREQLREFINRPETQRMEAGGFDALRKFIEEKRDIDTTHPIVPEWAYEKAQWRIQKKLIRKHELERIALFLENHPDYEVPENWRVRAKRYWVGDPSPRLKGSDSPGGESNKTP